MSKYSKLHGCVWWGAMITSLWACAPIDSTVGSVGSSAKGGGGPYWVGSDSNLQGQGSTPSTSISQGQASSSYIPPWISQSSEGGASSTSLVQNLGGLGGAQQGPSSSIVQGSGGAPPYSTTSVVQGSGGAPYTTTSIYEARGGASYSSIVSTVPFSDESAWAPRVPDAVLPLTGSGPLAGAWDGPIWYQAPGYAGPPLDFLTIVLDDQHLRSVDFRQFFLDDLLRPTSLAGDDNGGLNPAYSIESETFTASGFEIRYHNANAKTTRPVDTMIVRGQLRDDGRLAVDYSSSGVKSNGAEFAASGSATLNKVGAATRLPYPTIRGNWYNVVDVTAPGFAGTPRDQMTIAFTDEGLLRCIRLQNGPDVLGSFGDAASEWPLSGSRLVHAENNNDYDAEVQHSAFGPTSFDYAIRIRDHAQPTLYDLVMSVVGNLDSTGLVVDYHCDGTMWGAQINQHAQGTLLP